MFVGRTLNIKWQHYTLTYRSYAKIEGQHCVQKIFHSVWSPSDQHIGHGQKVDGQHCITRFS